MNTTIPKKQSGAFTLVEMLVVIAIIAVLAGMIFPLMATAKKSQSLATARAELKIIQDAISNYQLKYGTYPPGNQLAPSANNPCVNPLFYELSGINYSPSIAVGYTNLDGGNMITRGTYSSTFGADGVVNMTHGSGEDAKRAENFLTGIRSGMIGTTTGVTPGPKTINLLVTSLRGPDANWRPLGPLADVNPFCYTYPGTNNPGSYDLWVELHINGKSYIVGNWTAK